MTIPVLQSGVSTQIVVSASDPDNGISTVTVTCDGSSIGTCTYSAPNYILNWTPSAALYGSRALCAIAQDVLGVTTLSQVVNVVIDSAPVVSIGYPTAGANLVQGVGLTITGAMSDPDSGDSVSSIDISYNGSSIGSASLGSSTWSLAWTPTVPQIGTHNLLATAQDGHGITTASAGVSVTVASASTPPNVAISTPTTGSIQSNPYVVSCSGTCSGNGGATITGVSLYFNGTLLGSATVTGGTSWTYSWSPNVSLIGTGAHNLVARATDSNSATTDSTAVALSVVDGSLPTSYPSLLNWIDADHLTGVTTTDYSNLSSGYTATACTITAGQADPFSGTAAYLLTESASTTYHYYARTATSYGDIKVDVYAKANGARHLQLASQAGYDGVTVNLTTGVVGYTGSTDLWNITVTSAGSGWWRVQGVISRTSSLKVQFGISNLTTGQINSYAGDGTSGVFVYVAELSNTAGQNNPVLDRSGNGNHLDPNSDSLITSPLELVTQRIFCNYALQAGMYLSDRSAVLTALSGTDSSFTVSFLARQLHQGSNVAQPGLFSMTGSTASFKALCIPTNSAPFTRYNLTRTNNAGTTKTASWAGTDPTADYNWHVFTLVFNAGIATLYIDNQASSPQDLSGGACTWTNIYTSCLGAMWRERVLFSRALSDSERQAVEAGIRSRASLTLDKTSPLQNPGCIAWFAPNETQKVPYILNECTFNAPSTWTATGLQSYTGTTFTETSAAGFHTASGVTGVNQSAGTVLIKARLTAGSRTYAKLICTSGESCTYSLSGAGSVSHSTSSMGTISLVSTGVYDVTMGSGEPANTSVTLYVGTGPTTFSYTGDNGVSGPALTLSNFSLYQNRISRLFSLCGPQYNATVGGTTLGNVQWCANNATAANQPNLSGNGYISAWSYNSAKKSICNVGSGTTQQLTVDLPSGTLNLVNHPITVCMLVSKVTNINVAPVLIGAGTPYYKLTLSTSGTSASRRDGSSAVASDTTSTTVPMNGHSFVMSSFDGTTDTIYLNGSSISSANIALAGTWNASGNNAIVFTFDYLSVVEIALFSRSLTSTERTNIEAGMRARAGL